MKRLFSTATLAGACGFVVACNAVWGVDELLTDEAIASSSGGGGAGSGGSAAATNGTVSTATSTSSAGGNGGDGGSAGNGGSSAGGGGSSAGGGGGSAGGGGNGGSGGAPTPFCGDNIIQSGEECDDGNSVNNDTCSNACIVICPAGWWKNVASFMCRRGIESPLSWVDAEADCITNHAAHLVSIHSGSEQNSIESTAAITLDFYWIGAREMSDAGYQWTSGEPFTYDNWDPTAPDPNSCAFADRNTNEWSTTACADPGITHPYVCERLPAGT